MFFRFCLMVRFFVVHKAYLSLKALYSAVTLSVSCVNITIWGFCMESTVFRFYLKRLIMSSRTSCIDFSSPRCVDTFFSVTNGIESGSSYICSSLSAADSRTTRFMFSIRATCSGSAPLPFIFSLSFSIAFSRFSSRPSLVSPERWFLARSLYFWRNERLIRVFSAWYSNLTFYYFSITRSICLLSSWFRYWQTVALSAT